VFPKDHPEFITVTCLDWKYLLHTDSRKDIIVSSLRFLATKGRAIIYAFVVMSNHLHIIWQFDGEHEGPNVLRDFLKFTSHQILRDVKFEDPAMYKKLKVNAYDRTYQVWQRKALRIPLWSNNVFNQKLEYIHRNPVKAGLCKYPEQYRYSSARFYLLNQTEWEFLTHADG
jgi:putative transposase